MARWRCRRTPMPALPLIAKARQRCAGSATPWPTRSTRRRRASRGSWREGGKMADLATAFRDRLVANGAVNAVVSTRIYWGVVPQGAALPYVRLHIISDPRPEHLKGYQGSRRRSEEPTSELQSLRRHLN